MEIFDDTRFAVRKDIEVGELDGLMAKSGYERIESPQGACYRKHLWRRGGIGTVYVYRDGVSYFHGPFTSRGEFMKAAEEFDAERRFLVAIGATVVKEHKQ